MKGTLSTCKASKILKFVFVISFVFWKMECAANKWKPYIQVGVPPTNPNYNEYIDYGEDYVGLTTSIAIKG